MRAQEVIVRLVRQAAPALRIEGEETQQPSQIHRPDLKIDTAGIDTGLSLGSVPEEECVLWIDPMDGTKSFLDG